jgi:hypothetical protein
MTVMLAPVPSRSYSTSSGTVYTADQWGVIARVATLQDQTDLKSAGCITLTAGLAQTKLRLTANQTYYVRKDGSNSNDGLTNTALGAWLTLQYAFDWVCQNIEGGGWTVTLQLGDSATPYDGLYPTKNFDGTIYITGNHSDVTAVTIKDLGNTICALESPLTVLTVILSDMTLEGTLNTYNALRAWYKNYLGIGWDPVAGNYGRPMKIKGKWRYIFEAGYQGRAEWYGPTTVDLSTTTLRGFAYVNTQGYMWLAPSSVNLVSAFTMSVAWMMIETLSYAYFRCDGGVTGTATGSKYSVTSNSISEQGSTLPGTVAGSTSTGGQVI